MFIEQFGLRDTSSWSLVAARSHLAANGVEQNRFVQCTFRPFDMQWTYYSTDVLERPLERVIGHLTRENLALVTFRHTRRPILSRAFVARRVVDARLLSSESNCYAFPLYRYTDQPESSGQLALDTSGGAGREPNLHPALLSRLTAAYGSTVTSEDVFYYIYGILNSPGFLQEFEILLHEDFSRIPFTADDTLFAEMVAKGERLIKLHLLEATDLQGLPNLTVGFPVNGNNEVASGYPQYNPTEERVYINSGQYFSNITPSMWEYEVGGYTPLEKWLRDRRGHTLSANERRHYETLSTAIGKTLNELPDIENIWQAIYSGTWFNLLAQQEW